MRNVDPSATIAINEHSADLEARGRRVFRLGLGQSPFPVPERVVEALRQHAAEKDYLPVKGLPALREAVADFHRSRDRVDAHPDRILIGPGSKELMFLLQLCFDNEILVPTPCWVSYAPQARIVGRPVTPIPTSLEDGWKLTPDALRIALASGDRARPRLLVLNYPANPHGGSYTEGELAALAKVARDAGVTVLSDEIYGLLHFRGEHASIARYYPEGTILSSGLSKWCGAGGWRLGTFTFPADMQWLLDAMKSVASETYTSVSAPIQYAAVSAFRGGDDIDAYLQRSRRILAAVTSRATRLLRDAGVAVHQPEGGFYLFPDFSPQTDRLAARGITDSRALCERLLQDTGVATLPGADFGRPTDELTARLALVNFDGERALAAASAQPVDQPLPVGFVDRWCADTVEAVERIAAWVREPGA